MDDIPKIELKPTQLVNKPVAPTQQLPEPKINEVSQVPMAKKKKVPIVPLIALIIFLVLAGGAYAAFSKFVVWDDGGETETSSASSAYIPSKLPPSIEDHESSSSSTEVSTAGIKGKLTVSITREEGMVLEGAVARLISSSGKTVKEVDTGKSGVAVFDGIAAGSYKIEGGKKGEKRVTVQSITLTDGEIKDVTLSLFLDTTVTITVTVKKPDGSAFADQSFTLRKIRSSEAPLDYTVTTNNFGMFTKSDISPDDGWLLVQDGEEIGSFSVAPTGKNQTINVQTKSN